MELFDKKFVHFMWDDELEGMGGFFADNIGTLKEQINNGVAEYLHNTKSRYEDKPFANCYSTYRFFYYDPNYEAKKAFNEGKKIQVYDTIADDWVDLDEPLWCMSDKYRIKPEEEKWIAYLARETNGACYLSACIESYWKDAQKEFGAKTKLFIGAYDEVNKWYGFRQKFSEVIKAWEDGKEIQFRQTCFNGWVDVRNPCWDVAYEYRVKPEENNGGEGMMEVTFTFSSQLQADSTVMALSNGYKVEQFYMPMNTTMKPYCVRVRVSSNDISKVD